MGRGAVALRRAFATQPEPGTLQPRSLTCLFLVPDCEDRHNIVVNPVLDNIATIAKVDEPFPEAVGKIVAHPAEVRVRTKHFHAQPNRFTGSMGGISVLRAKKVTQSLQIPDRRRDEYYLWHLGAGSSSSAPQLASH